MSESDNQSTETPGVDFTRTWRYKVGLGLIIVGHSILFSGLVLPMLGVSASIVGTAVLGGELVSLASIVFLGTAGFKAIKSKGYAFVKSGYATRVGPVRHYMGMALLCTNVVTTYIIAAYAWTAFDITTAERPMHMIWGLDFAQQGSMVFWLFFIGNSPS
ncbi:MAG: hypothetical protein ACQ9IQ_01295 [Nitrospirales bacterium]